MKKLLEILVLGLLLIKPAFGAGKKVDQKKRQNIKNRRVAEATGLTVHINKYADCNIAVCPIEVLKQLERN